MRACSRDRASSSAGPPRGSRTAELTHLARTAGRRRSRAAPVGGLRRGVRRPRVGRRPRSSPPTSTPTGSSSRTPSSCYGDLAVIARPARRRAPRRGRRVERAVRDLGLRVAHIEAPGTLDGGDVLRAGGTAYVGLGGRTNGVGIQQLANAPARVRCPRAGGAGRAGAAPEVGRAPPCPTAPSSAGARSSTTRRRSRATRTCPRSRAPTSCYLADDHLLMATRAPRTAASYRDRGLHGDRGRRVGVREARGLRHLPVGAAPPVLSGAYGRRMAETGFDEWIAARYETLWPELFEPAVLESAVALARRAGRRRAGAGVRHRHRTRRRAALSRRSVRVRGIELSPAMVARLPRPARRVPDVDVTIGDFATATVARDRSTLVYLVRNTITNLTTQDEQVRSVRATPPPTSSPAAASSSRTTFPSCAGSRRARPAASSPRRRTTSATRSTTSRPRSPSPTTGGRSTVQLAHLLVAAPLRVARRARPDGPLAGLRPAHAGPTGTAARSRATAATTSPSGKNRAVRPAAPAPAPASA